MKNSSKSILVTLLLSLACNESAIPQLADEESKASEETTETTSPIEDLPQSKGELPIIELQASENCVQPDVPVTINWNIAGASDCVADHNIGSIQLPTGSADVIVDSTTEFLFTCNSSAGTTAKPISIAITKPINTQVDVAFYFERIPVSNGGLNYSATASRPIRGASVSVLDVCSGNEITQIATDSSGRISFPHDGNTLLEFLVYAETQTPSIQIVDNTSGGALYALSSGQIDLNLATSTSIIARSGWTGGSYGDPRSAGPFAILDTMYEAAAQFTATDPTLVFPPLTVNWSVDNRPDGNGTLADGALGSSFWNGSALYILGQADIDTDEYDQHVIVHEWAHYFESELSRADSTGGPHGAGDILDPRVAMSEGWGNALSALILSPDTSYRDTFGTAQDAAFGFDVNDNLSADPAPGWFSESSVQSIIFDFVDASGDQFEPWDNISIGLNGIVDLLTGSQRSTTAFTTIFSLVSGLKTLALAADSDIDAIGWKHNITTITNIWGTGATNNGGDTDFLPVYHQLGAPASQKTIHFTGGASFNKLQQSRFLRFTGTGGAIRIRTVSTSDVDPYVFKDGLLLGSEFTPSGNESVTLANTVLGDEYTVAIEGWEFASIAYTATIHLEIP